MKISTSRVILSLFMAVGLFQSGCGGDGGDGGGTSPILVVDDGVRRAILGNGDSRSAALSQDGRWLVFSSAASDLVVGDVNGYMDVFRADLQTRQIELASMDSLDVKANGDSGKLSPPTVSGDGLFVAFSSTATNLSTLTQTAAADVYIRDTVLRQTRQESRNRSGIPGNGNSLFPSLSSDSDYLAFQSRATNLVDIDRTVTEDIFLMNRASGEIERVSTALSGLPTDGPSRAPAVSKTGRYVAFESDAANLTLNDTNGVTDIFVRDRIAGSVTRVSLRTNGDQANAQSFSPRISDDGTIVSFASRASNLVGDDSNRVADIFVHDRQTGTTMRVNLPRFDKEANGDSRAPSMSGDGTLLAFVSQATNFTPEVYNGLTNIYVVNRISGALEMVNRNVDRGAANGLSEAPCISGDGGFIAFESSANNLIRSVARSSTNVYVFPNPLP